MITVDDAISALGNAASIITVSCSGVVDCWPSDVAGNFGELGRFFIFGVSWRRGGCWSWGIIAAFAWIGRGSGNFASFKTIDSCSLSVDVEVVDMRPFNPDAGRYDIPVIVSFVPDIDLEGAAVLD